jgi:hypothetical protein
VWADVFVHQISSILVAIMQQHGDTQQCGVPGGSPWHVQPVTVVIYKRPCT